MSFPPTVKEEALVRCGRHCCICHKFCGIKIECHHIVAAGDGGTDSLDNCIPVCFDCHSDMKSYDFKHPKGSKYSASELRLHRDSWHAKFASSGAVSAAPNHVEVDRAVFKSFQESVPYFPTFDHLREQHFGNSYERAPFKPLFHYAHYADRVEYEFTDAELEGARGRFVAAVRAFTRALGKHTFPTHNSGRSCVPPEWATTQPELFERVVQEINDAADEVQTAYAEVVRLARRRLGVAGVIDPPSSDSQTDTDA